MANYDLDGKVAFITGGARGIGLGTAKALHARGASVTLLDLDGDQTARAAEQVGERALGLGGDVTDPDSLEAAVAATVERFGGLDVAVANAGISPMARTARVYETELWEKVIDINLMGVWRTVRAALPHVVERRGHLVLVSSIYAFTNGAFVTPYAAAKAAVEQLGRALRVELAPHGVSAGVAYFGFVDTEMVRLSMREDPMGERFEAVIPRAFRKKISPERAGDLIARGIERRAPRTIAPRRWTIPSVLRGLVNPGLDAAAMRDDRVQALVREADTEGRLDARVG